MEIPVSLIVFEDRALGEHEEFSRLLPMPHEQEARSDLRLSVDWHQLWNHLGEKNAQARSLKSRPITDLAVFAEALSFVATGSIKRAILFIDVQLFEAHAAIDLRACAVAKNLLRPHCQEFLAFCRSLGANVGSIQSLDDALDVLNRNRQGLLLAWMSIANTRVTDCDLWMSSGVMETDVITPRLREAALATQRNMRVFDAGGSVSRDGPEKTAARFRRAFDKFSERYAGIEARLWPGGSSDCWFAMDGCPEVPHKYEDLIGEDYKAAYKRLLGDYLRVLTGRVSVPGAWFADKGLHETLKRLLGDDAAAQPNGKGLKQPSLAAILLLLAAAEKDEDCVPSPDQDWLSEVIIDPAALLGIVPAAFEGRQTRAALLALHGFFRKIVAHAASKPSAAGSGKITNVAAASWYERATSLHLVLELAIDCLTPEPGKATSLLEKLFNRPWRAGYRGDTTEAYYAFRSALSHSDGTLLALTVYPHCEDGRVRTRFDFNVPGSDC